MLSRKPSRCQTYSTKSNSWLKCRGSTGLNRKIIAAYPWRILTLRFWSAHSLEYPSKITSKLFLSQQDLHRSLCRSRMERPSSSALIASMGTHSTIVRLIVCLRYRTLQDLCQRCPMHQLSWLSKLQEYDWTTKHVDLFNLRPFQKHSIKRMIKFFIRWRSAKLSYRCRQSKSKTLY